VLQDCFGHDLVFEKGEPECIVPLDDLGGEQRNCDLVVSCSARSEKITLSVEAKADEPFGSELVGNYYDRITESSVRSSGEDRTGCERSIRAADRRARSPVAVPVAALCSRCAD
jgi:hypothetical protein